MKEVRIHSLSLLLLLLLLLLLQLFLSSSPSQYHYYNYKYGDISLNVNYCDENMCDFSIPIIQSETNFKIFDQNIGS